MEHKPFVGDEYRHAGIDGQHLAIVGYSHWNSNLAADSELETVTLMHEIIKTPDRASAFFSAIAHYFGLPDVSAFWRRVVFFNYLPVSVGGPNEGYGHGTAEQVAAAKARFLRIVYELSPDKVVVFTSRHWAFPPSCDGALAPAFPKFRKRELARRGDDTAVPVYLLRHPQGARGDVMRAAISLVLADRRA